MRGHRLAVIALSLVLVGACGSRRAVPPTIEPVDGRGQSAGDGYTVSRDGHVAHPRDAFFREGIVFDSCAFTVCGGKCVDLTSDPENCGSCGSSCGSGQPCVNGVCSVSCKSKQWQNHVYHFCSQQLTWRDASMACNAGGKQLAVIDSAAENTWVSNEIVGAFGVGGWWIGLVDLEATGSWIWQDGTSVGYASWAKGEPNSSKCGSLNAGSGTWKDEPCTGVHSYVCESACSSGVCTKVLLLHENDCLVSNGTGGGYNTLYLGAGFKKAILTTACFDDNGHIDVNGQKVFADNGGCCSAACHTANIDVTGLVKAGSNTIYGYVDDCCGGCAWASATFKVSY